VIVLDTDVLSALMRREPEPAVVDWLDQQPAESIWTTTVTLFEARFGLARLPEGKRKRTLEIRFGQLLDEDIERRILDLDQAAADTAARLAAEREQSGRPVDLRDTMIAGIVLARRAKLATRNTKHFADLEVDVIDPGV
jgi:toxin FitB